MSDDGDTHAADAFAALSDPTRVAIVRALVDRQRERPTDPALGFAALRKRVGVEDSGRFRYHLNELRGRFVEQADDGYRLTYAGTEVGAAIVAGTYTDTERVGPTELDSACPLCGATAVGTYADGVLDVSCADGHPLFQWGIPPNAADGASIDDLIDLATVLVRRAIDLIRAGSCPKCYDPVEPRLVPFEDGESPGPRLRSQCDACGGRLEAPVGFRLFTVPDVAAFYRRHGRDLREAYIWEHDFVRDDAATQVDGSGDGFVRVAVVLDDEALAVTLDERAALVDAATGPADHLAPAADATPERDANPQA